MATHSIDLARESPDTIESTVSSIKKMVKVGAVFVGIGYLLVVGALVLELTQFHPLIESFFTTHSGTSLVGGGPERTAAVSSELATIHKYPSMLMWLKLGGVAHVLVGIFVALAAIVRALALMPHRLSYEMERTQG